MTNLYIQIADEQIYKKNKGDMAREEDMWVRSRREKNDQRAIIQIRFTIIHFFIPISGPM